ncbi:hypothetical protein [Devosia sediminis]|uniref:Uncharacterized protein n=1 Tax=Devosia sediminis TaxID=2798801 RepID=A0A934MQI6_9HYPH|nr:hypothetical protein [Devosia sediminis]MBJ3784399.1 hypothetical protein [Devosia sediminis]
MHRIIVAALLSLMVSPAVAQPMDDFDCVSDLEGPDTPAGTMRVSGDSTFAWLDPATATPGEFYSFELFDERVNFDPAFAEHIAPGSQLIEASYFQDAATFEAVLFIPDKPVVLVSCSYIF